MTNRNRAPREKEDKEEKKSKAPIMLLFIPLIVIVVVIAISMGGSDRKDGKKVPDTPDFLTFKRIIDDLKRQLPEARRCAKEFERPRIEKTVLKVIKALEDKYKNAVLSFPFLRQQALCLLNEAERVYREEYETVKMEGEKDPNRTLLDECRVYLRCTNIIHTGMNDIYEYWKKTKPKEMMRIEEGTQPAYVRDAQNAGQLWSQIRYE